MKPIFTATTMIAKLAKSKLVFCASVLGLVMSLQVATISSPAHALPLYADNNGGINCSVCHTTRGILNRNMKEFTSAGNYFKNNNRLPNNNNNNGGWNNNNNNNNGSWNNNNNNNNGSWNNNNNNGSWNNNNNNGNNSGYSCGRGFRTEDSTDYRGNDINGYRESFNSCKRRCRNNWNCQGISWIKTNARHNCWLKFRMSRSSYKWSVVSCIKR